MRKEKVFFWKEFSKVWNTYKEILPSSLHPTVKTMHSRVHGVSDKIFHPTDEIVWKFHQ